jgi:hypothetical protein
VTKMIRLLTVALLLFGIAGVRAQESQPAPQAPSRPAFVPLKVTLVFSRFQGEKKITSVPFVFFVTANDKDPTSLRMGTRIPVVSTVFGAKESGGAATIPQASYSYQDVGTNIDCVASTASDGMFRLNLTVTDSSVYYPDRSETVTSPSAATGAPGFRNFSSKFNILLRDGQNAQYIAASDPVSGQTVKIDATVNVQK